MPEPQIQPLEATEAFFHTARNQPAHINTKHLAGVDRYSMSTALDQSLIQADLLRLRATPDRRVSPEPRPTIGKV